MSKYEFQLWRLLIVVKGEQTRGFKKNVFQLSHGNKQIKGLVGKINNRYIFRNLELFIV